MPRAGVDKNIYKYPVGAYQWSLWKAGTREFQVNYREDPRALKLLSQAQWEGERPLWDVRTYQPVGTTEAIRSARYVSMQRTLNYLRCASNQTHSPRQQVPYMWLHWQAHGATRPRLLPVHQRVGVSDRPVLQCRPRPRADHRPHHTGVGEWGSLWDGDHLHVVCLCSGHLPSSSPWLLLG